MKKHVPMWRVTGELDWDASSHGIVTVKANTERKARILGEEKLKTAYRAFAVKDIAVERIEEKKDD